MAGKTTLELAVNSGKWDAGLRRAQTELNRFIQTQGGLEAAIKADSQAMTQFVGMMGKTESTAKTARGQVNEYKNTIEQLSRVYNQLSASDKNSSIGRTLNQSIEQLTSKMRDAQNEMRNTSQLMGEQSRTGGELSNIIDGIAGKFGLSTKSLTAWGAALAGATTALSVVKDAFFSNEAQLDEWCRTVESAESVYKSFLDSLNTGDIGGFLSRIGDIVNAARAAYDAMDNLNTHNAFNQMNMEDARTGMQAAINDYREGKGSKENVKAAANKLIQELKTRQELERNVYKSAVNDLAAQRGVNGDDLLRVLTGSKHEFEHLKNLPLSGSKRVNMTGSGLVPISTEIAVPANETERLGDALRRINDSELNRVQALGAQAKSTAHEIENIEKTMIRVFGQRGLGTSGGTSSTTKSRVMVGGVLPVPGLDAGALPVNGFSTTQSMSDMQQMLQGYQKALKDATTQAEYIAATEGIARMKELIAAQPFALKMGVDAETVAAWREQAQAMMNEIEPIKIGMVVEGGNGLKDGKAIAKDWTMAASAIRDVGNALNGLKDPAAQVMGTIAQAIANVALGYGQAMAAKDSTASGWAWLGFAASATATMLSAVSAIKNATAGSYANGGIVPGTDWHDGLTANVSSGELILNKAQQGNLASQLRDDESGGGGAAVRLRGEDLWFAISTHLRRKGKGEFLKFFNQ